MNSNIKLYEILVPTIYGDTKKPIKTKHHKVWDERVRKITGGLTILGVAKGQWINEQDNELFIERVIPVRIACTEKEMDQIVEFSLNHYRQIAVMFFLISDKVEIRYKKD